MGDLAGIYGEGASASVSDLISAVGGRPADAVGEGMLAIAWTDGALASTHGRCGTVLQGELEGVYSLRQDVGGETDPETVAQAYDRLGSGVLDRLRGRFSLLLWRRGTGDAVLAVDQLAAAAVFTYEQNGRLYFASEIRILLRLLPRTPSVDELSLIRYIAGEPGSADETPYQGMRRLPGGHLLQLTDGRWRERRYWEPRYVQSIRIDRAELPLRVLDEVQRSVVKRAEEGRTGVLLSGGLDSTSVAAAAHHASPPIRLRAYSALFPRHAETDESVIVENLATQLRQPLTRVVVQRASVLRHSLEYLRDWNIPSPSPNLYFNLPALRAASADGMSVMLDGEGGDELFGCVPYLAGDRLLRGRALSSVQLIRRLPFGDTEQSWRATRHLFTLFALKGAAPAWIHAASGLTRARDQGGPGWLGADARRRLADGRDAWAWKRADGPRWWAFLADTLTRSRARIGVTDALRRMGRMSGIERRHPFMDDLDLIEFVLRLPPELAFDARLTRPLLREAMRSLLPDPVRLRTSKANFSPLIEESFAGPERDIIARLILAKDARIRVVISSDVAEDAVAKVNQPGFVGYQGALLRMVTAECWLRTLENPSFPEQMLQEGELPPAEVELVTGGSD